MLAACELRLFLVCRPSETRWSLLRAEVRQSLLIDFAGQSTWQHADFLELSPVREMLQAFGLVLVQLAVEAPEPLGCGQPGPIEQDPGVALALLAELLRTQTGMLRLISK